MQGGWRGTPVQPIRAPGTSRELVRRLLEARDEAKEAFQGIWGVRRGGDVGKQGGGGGVVGREKGLEMRDDAGDISEGRTVSAA